MLLRGATNGDALVEQYYFVRGASFARSSTVQGLAGRSMLPLVSGLYLTRATIRDL